MGVRAEPMLAAKVVRTTGVAELMPSMAEIILTIGR